MKHRTSREGLLSLLRAGGCPRTWRKRGSAERVGMSSIAGSSFQEYWSTQQNSEVAVARSLCLCWSSCKVCPDACMLSISIVPTRDPRSSSSRTAPWNLLKCSSQPWSRSAPPRLYLRGRIQRHTKSLEEVGSDLPRDCHGGPRQAHSGRPSGLERIIEFKDCYCCSGQLILVGLGWPSCHLVLKQGFNLLAAFNYPILTSQLPIQENLSCFIKFWANPIIAKVVRLS